jgi:hypothetical protein
MEQWRKDAIKDGYVCEDCHEPVNKADRVEFLLRGRRCRLCYSQHEKIKARTQYERETKPTCE